MGTRPALTILQRRNGDGGTDMAISTQQVQRNLPNAALAARALAALPAETAWQRPNFSEPAYSGWHESSWALRHGLDIVELPAAALPAEWRGLVC
jgi:hypothetical protein